MDFREAKTPEEVIGMLVGACSTARFWSRMHEDYPHGEGVFLDVTAKALADAAIARLHELK